MTFSVRYKTFDQLSFADVQVYTKLPPHPFWSHVDSKCGSVSGLVDVQKQEFGAC
ncbi:hypothetical protein Theco_3489 [Thermobacillus composti KWC4]|jgi:hypothetical protein|uniref:Uncharacterized protein n=1 Tax=Thermobacillus composti (strain DSM 18247 / JCM 13945 / KWC4) TaxID=717605 RepID=L0EIS9_THECK|nr:hypothetical protein [Thermobacillus composti]AGA59529.1 hypothetical protein Theco_3489 [Thermobacillus composti KWC4]